MVTIAFHKDMTLEKWALLPATKQILNIASELGRAESSLKNGLLEPFRASVERVLELTDLTIEVHLKNEGLTREMLRFREVLAGIYADPAPQIRIGEFRPLKKVFLALEPGAYNLLGVAL